jgi:hypothetical protein
MPVRDLTEFVDLTRERELEQEREPDETSTERFDRLAFAERALAMIRPHATRVALGESRTRVMVDAGRAWGKADDARWAVLRVPPTASRRAIAIAVLALVRREPDPWVVDALLEGAA